MERKTGRPRLRLIKHIEATKSVRPASLQNGPDALRPSGIALRLELLGAFTLRAPSSKGPSLPKKAQALLAYLAVQARPMPREQLATLLWADRGTEQARRSLRQCLMSLRSALHPHADDIIMADISTIRLMLADHIDCDILKFERFGKSQDVADLEMAEGLYRDEFLAGLQVSSQPFLEWLAAERRRFSSMQSDILYRLAMAQAQAGAAERAIETAQQLSVFDPLREDGHRLLIRLLASAGRRSDALKQYALCAETLRRELGVAVERGTTTLAEQIRKGEAESGESVAADAVAASPREPKTTQPPPGSTHSALSISDKTSIAVLPFTNIGHDREQDYFAEGIAEDVSLALGHIPWLFVIPSSSTLGYLGRAVDMRQIGAELGVRYLLRGSVRRDTNRVRIVVQLTDSSNGGYLSSQRFEGPIGDVFEIQDRFTTQIAAMIAPALHAVEIKRAQRTATKDLNAYDLYLRALPRFRTSLAQNEEAVRLLRQAIEIDPAYGAAYGLGARCYQFQKLFGWVAPNDPRFREGVRLANLAVEVGKDDSEALWMAGLALAQLAGEVKHGRLLIDKSLSLNPNSASAWIASCLVHAYLGNVEAAMEHFACAQRLNPLDSMHHVQTHAAATAHYLAGNCKAAAECADKAVSERPTYPPSLRMKAVTCALLGKPEEARAWLRRLRSVNPNETVSSVRGYIGPQWQYKQQALESFLQGLRLAGLPEGEE